MELTFRRVLLGFLVMFLGLEALLGYWVVWRGPQLEAHTRNPRRIAAEARIQRGGIKDRSGELLAASTWVGHQYQREYLGPLSAAHTIGYAHVRFGKSGLERAYDEELRGASVRSKNGWADIFARQIGLDITTTLDANVQRAAEKALAGRRGAVVVLNAETGAILAAASVPVFDPNNMSDALFAGATAGPLFNRALQGRYPPGSSWKPLILAAALESGAVAETDTFRDTKSIVVDGYEISNFEGSERGRLGLKGALSVSSNVVFVQIGLATGGSAIRQLAQRMGLLEAPNLRVPAAASHLPSAESFKQRSVVAEVSIGQGETWVSPLHMAVLAAAIGNGGYAVRPYLVQAVGTRDVTPSRTRTRVISPSVARFVADAMREVVTSGTGRRAAVPQVAVAGKTGTADNPAGKAHAWFIGFAPYGEGVVAVAVVLENAGTGGTLAAPVAAEVIKAAVSGGRGKK